MTFDGVRQPEKTLQQTSSYTAVLKDGRIVVRRMNTSGTFTRESDWFDEANIETALNKIEAILKSKQEGKPLAVVLGGEGDRRLINTPLGDLYKILQVLLTAQEKLQRSKSHF